MTIKIKCNQINVFNIKKFRINLKLIKAGYILINYYTNQVILKKQLSNRFNPKWDYVQKVDFRKVNYNNRVNTRIYNFIILILMMISTRV